MHIHLPALAMLLAASACDARAADDAAVQEPRTAAASSRCAAGAVTLPQSDLCPAEAAALLIDASAAPVAAMEGCSWVISETPFATDLLLYRALRCGHTQSSVALEVGNHMSNLVYSSRSDGGSADDADGSPIILGRVFAGNPDGRSRILWEARDSVGDAKAAKRCQLKPPYQSDGLPTDALIVDVARSAADLARDDATPVCGPFGYNPAGGSIDFWRAHQGYAWFFQMGTDVWDVDPGSFTIITRDDSGVWKRVADPS